MLRAVHLVVAAVGVSLLGGCTGNIRDTTTPRTASEQLLMTTAAQRAIASVDSQKIAQCFVGKRVFVDATRLATQSDRAYVVAAYEQFVAQSKGFLVPAADKADLVVEVRSAALGTYELSYGITVPLAYAGMVVSDVAQNASFDSQVQSLPTAFDFGYHLQEGWAKLSGYCYDRRSGLYVCGWRECWGRAYEGLFDDIYPAFNIDTLASKVR